MRNGMYLFATAIVAGTMGLASCSNDEDVVAGGEAQSVANNVTLGVYVNGGVNKKASQNDVNLGNTIADISNIVVVPVSGGVYQVPIDFEDLIDITGTARTAVKNASLLTTVDEFMVYGNVPETTLTAGTNAFGGFKYFVPSSQKDENLVQKGFTADLCGPMALIYGADAKSFSTSENATAETFWNPTGVIWAEGSVITTNTKGIKIQGVKYQVGVLASKVFENTKYTDNPEFDSPEGLTPLTADVNWGEEISAKMNLTGVFVEGQATTFNDKLEWSGDAWLADAAPSSESVDRATHADGEWETMPEKIKVVTNDGTYKVDGADFYTVVAPDADGEIAVSFQFQNNTGRKLTMHNGDIVENGDYAYYSVKLNKKNDQNVFTAATTTILNARITDWGNGTKIPPTTTDLVIGVEFEVNWAEGLSYDFEI